MWEIIIYGFAVYGMVSLWILLLHRTSWWNREQQTVHIVLLLQDSQSKVEWVFRSLQQMSHLTGKPLSFTCIDFGSQDDTLAIIERLSYNIHDIHILLEHHGGQDILNEMNHVSSKKDRIFIDLRNYYEGSAQLLG